MKIILDNNSGKREIEIAVTKTLDDMAGGIREAYGVSDLKYLYVFGGKVYSIEGDLDSIIHQCDLFIYSAEPAFYYSKDIMVQVYHENISDNIYDYCDFENPHYCSVFEESIDIDSCYTSMMCLNGFVKHKACTELMTVTDMDVARKKCKRCIYTNCDGIHHEQTLKKLSLENIQPSQRKYRVHLTQSSPGAIDEVRSKFFKRFLESDDYEE